MERKSVDLFFNLIQLAVGNKPCLMKAPSPEEWSDLYDMAEKQSVLGICFVGLQKIKDKTCYPPTNIILKWISIAQNIKDRNNAVRKEVEELQKSLSDAGINSSLLKGQGLCPYYGSELAFYRQPGDIDIYVDGGRESALFIANRTGAKNVEWDYKHVRFLWHNNTEVEIHYRVEVLLNLWKNWKLQRWFKKHHDLMFEQKEGLITPTITFNLFYILLHIYRHFLYEGIGLRQMMDYYFLLSQNDITVKDKALVKDAINSFGMLKFAQGVMWLMKVVFGLDENLMLVEPNEKEGTYILKTVMTGGNFGFYDKKFGKTKYKKVSKVLNIVSHSFHCVKHYPSDVLWTPVWIIWHKIWKISVQTKSPWRVSQRAGACRTE